MAYIITYRVDGDPVDVVAGSLAKVLETVRELRAAGYGPTVTTAAGAAVNITEDDIQGKPSA